MVYVFMVYFYLCVLIIDSCCRHLIWGTFIQKRCHSFLFQGIRICSVFYFFVFVLMIQMIGRVLHCKPNGKKHVKNNFFSYIDSKLLTRNLILSFLWGWPLLSHWYLILKCCSTQVCVHAYKLKNKIFHINIYWCIFVLFILFNSTSFFCIQK